MNGFFNPENACQAYIIAFGANDLNICELGTIEDIDFEDFFLQFLVCVIPVVV